MVVDSVQDLSGDPARRFQGRRGEADPTERGGNSSQREGEL